MENNGITELKVWKAFVLLRLNSVCISATWMSGSQVNFQRQLAVWGNGSKRMMLTTVTLTGSSPNREGTVSQALYSFPRHADVLSQSEVANDQSLPFTRFEA